MRKILNFLVGLSESVYAYRKESLNSMYKMYNLDEIPADGTRGAAAEPKPVKTYLLHHCPICNTDHY